MINTKIICTIGPATESYEMLNEMHKSGMNIVRLNMSHGTHEWHEKIIKQVKSLNKKLKFPIALLLDTKGPEIRTGDLANNLDLKTGEKIWVSVKHDVDVEHTSFHIDYEDLIHDMNIGDKITIDNGLINLKVLEKNDRMMHCKVIDGGVLKSKSHVNLPGIRVNLPGITPKDKEDILFGLKQNVDFIALSFVRCAEDILQLRELMGKKNGKIKVIAKIEDQEGVSNLQEIIDVSDGIMIARGDLGVEIDISLLPNVQRKISRMCAEQGKRVIVATHLLESMIKHPLPTRAEVTDVANAIYEEVDAIMLSGETTVGKYPIKCIQQMVNIAKNAELTKGLQFHQNLNINTDKQHVATSAVKLAEAINAQGIIVITRRGIMADFVTNCRPFQIPIYAFTNVSQTRRTLVLNRGISPYRITFSTNPEKTLQNAFSILRKREQMQPGKKVVVISDVLVDGSQVDAIQIRELPASDD
ncbi:MAG: pyruvate kinase [Methylococcales bacterium]|nr:pyruvate kinase [Methylococcales bacterium]